MTIYALSSGPGLSGVAVIRISGEETPSILKLLTKKDLPSPRVATLSKIINSNNSELIDEALVLWFQDPTVTLEKTWLNFMFMEVWRL